MIFKQLRHQISHSPPSPSVPVVISDEGVEGLTGAKSVDTQLG
jgi:hypothetical protein